MAEEDDKKLPMDPSKQEEDSAEEIVQKLTQVNPKIFDGISKEKRSQLIQGFAIIQKTHIGSLT